MRKRWKKTALPLLLGSLVSLAAFGPAEAEGVLNLNRDSALDILSSDVNLGREVAENLVRYREEHGPFRTVDELRKVPGFNESLLIRLEPYLDARGDVVVDVPDDDIPEELRVPLY